MSIEVQERDFLNPRQPVKYRYNGQVFDSLEELRAAMNGGGGALARASDAKATLERINSILDDNAGRKQAVEELFNQYAGRDRQLQQHEMAGLAGVLSSKWGIDRSYFQNVNEMFHRFDYSGDGSLDLSEAYDLIKFVLKEQKRELSPPKPGTRLAHLERKDLKQYFELSKKLGQGGQGAVYLAKEISSGTARVVKFYTKGQADVDDIKDEFDLLKKLDHPNVARICEAFEDISNIYVVSEPYTGGDLVTVTEKAAANGVPLTHQWLGAIFLQVLGGVGYLHSKKTMHCDLKEANVMIADDKHWAAPHVMLIDFGMAKSFHGSRVGGTPGYIPPEVWCHQLWTPKGDIFALAVTFWSIYNFSTGGPFVLNPTPPPVPIHCAFPGMEPYQYATVHRQMDCSRFPPGLKELVEQMAAKDFRKRPTAQQVVQSSYFQTLSTTGTQPLAPEMVKNLHTAARRTSTQNIIALEMANRKNLGQMKSLNDLFRTFDKDGDGSVGKDEASQALHSMGFNVSECAKMVDSLVGDDGKMKYSEFMARMIASQEAMSSSELAEVFQSLDTDGNGTLCRSELNELLKKPNMASLVDGRSAEDLIAEMDIDGDGVVGFEEFRRAMLGDSATASCHFSKGDVAEYYSRSQGGWIPCKIIEVDRRSGKVQVNVKPGAWVRPDSDVRKVHDHSDGQHHHARFAKGDSAEYYSPSYGKWVPCDITDVDPSNGNVQVSVKPGMWFDRTLQAKMLRKVGGGYKS